MRSGRQNRVKWGYRPVVPIEGEIWKTIPDHPMYEASNLGRIKKTTIVPGTLGNNDYESTHVMTNDAKKRARILTHQLVAAAFLGKVPQGLCVNHKDGNRLNNHIDNLEYVTPAENIRHAARLGRMSRRGKSNGRTKLTDIQVLEIRRLRAAGVPQVEVARQFGVNRHSIRFATNGQTWNHIPRQDHHAVQGE